jgi:hypothetical protein
MKIIQRGVFIALLLLISNFIKAEEGMWVISKLDSTLIQRMKSIGLQLTKEQIYSETKPSIKDAVVIFDNGCTGELVSANGLLFTNHHCGRDRVQQVSTDAKNYIRDGFWASSQKEEIPIKGLTVRFLIKSVDVTKQAVELLKTKGLRRVQAEIEKQFNDSVNRYTASLDAYSDGKYYVAIYQIFNDVRLVGVPPESVGNFGGETDNFEWPRQGADFSVFRVYADRDNLPAAYSADNQPYHPKSFLPVSLSGIKDYDFTLTIGFPGITERYITSYELKEDLEVKNRATALAKGKYIEVVKAEMDKDEAIRLKYSTKNFSAGNSYKLALGTIKLVNLSPAMQKKQAEEEEFQKWVKADPERTKKYGTCLATLQKNYELEHDAHYAHALLSSALFSDATLFGTRAKHIAELVEKKDNAQLEKTIEAFREWYVPFSKNYDAATDQKIVRAMLKMVKKELAPQYLPEIFSIINDKYHGDIDLYVNDLYAKSIFTTAEGVEKFLKKPKLTIREDPLFIYGTKVVDKLLELKKMTTDYGTEIRKADRLYDQGVREKDAGILKYPDANFSMRATYGSVEGVSPRDGLTYKSKTTLKGVIEKEDSTNFEFYVWPKIKQLYAKKDYGRYGENGELYTCFLSSTDITGGNSGSPVINGKGELIGLAFDGNWESLAGNIIYEPQKNRSINVDIRYVLFVIDKFAGAKNIIDELTIKQ